MLKRPTGRLPSCDAGAAGTAEVWDDRRSGVAVDSEQKNGDYSPPTADGFAVLPSLVNFRAEMDFRHRALFLLMFSAAFLGCRHNQAAQRELLERELRLQEDRIYELEAKLEDTQRRLHRFQGGDAEYCPEPSATFSSPAVVVPDISRPPDSTIAPGPSSGLPSKSFSRESLPDPIDIGPPKVELPTETRKEAVPSFSGMPVLSPPDPSKPEGVPNRSMTSPAVLPESSALPQAPSGPVIKEMSSPKFRSPSRSLRRESPAAPSVEAPPESSNLPTSPSVAAQPADDLVVNSIALNRRSGGWNADSVAGDDGILVIVEPRNAQGMVVPSAGDISLVVIDPAVAGEGGRYARWDFTTADAAATYRPAVDGGTAGLHFELPWPHAPPTHSRLKLFVRFTTDDGRRLQAERDLTIDLGNKAAQIVPKNFDSMPRGFSTRTASPAAAVNESPGGATLASPIDTSSAPGLNWGGAKGIAERPQSLPVAAEDAAPLGIPPAAISAPEGPMLGPALFPTERR